MLSLSAAHLTVTSTTLPKTSVLIYRDLAISGLNSALSKSQLAEKRPTPS
jgi:hypothetical protein